MRANGILEVWGILWFTSRSYLGSIWQLITNIALIVGTGISIDLQLGPALLSGLATRAFCNKKK